MVLWGADIASAGAAQSSPGKTQCAQQSEICYACARVTRTLREPMSVCACVCMRVRHALVHQQQQQTSLD
eukprot:1898395-Alexandrium_andersonii.AAC.1